MLKKISLIAILLLSAQLALFSQTRDYPPVYFSLNGGGFISSRENFSNQYDSNIGFTAGGGLGVPVSSRLYLTGRATYFSKSGTPLTVINQYSQDKLVQATEIRSGSAKFTQWLINAGIEYKISLSENFKLYPMAGIAFSKTTEKVITEYINYQIDTKASGILGYYAGTGLERKFETIPLSAFAEAYYNFYLKELSSSIMGNIGGANFNLGIRYYLNM